MSEKALLRLRSERRVRLLRRPENGHISAATNSALELAKGDWIAFMDQDDELSPLALLLAAATIRAKPQARIVYTDEDKLDAAGRPFEPHRKPDWNPDLLLSQNYLNHLTLMHRTTVRDLGGLRSEFDGSQDYDLVLRASAAVPAAQVAHVPHIAYHWRALDSSVAQGGGAKDYAGTAASARDRRSPRRARTGPADICGEVPRL